MNRSRSSLWVALVAVLVPVAAFGQADPLANCKYYVKVQKDFDQGMKYCEEAIELYPDDPEARYFGAWCLAEQGRFEEAYASYSWLLERAEEKDVKKHAKNAEKHITAYYAEHFNKGVQLIKDENYEAAQEEFHKANQINPKNVDALLNLGFAHNQLGDLDGAIDCFGRAIEQDPENSTAYRYCWVALSDRLKQERESEDTDPEAVAALSAKLRTTLDQILTDEELDPKTAADAHLQLADLDYAANENEAALTHVTKAIELAPETVVNLFNIAVGFYQTDQYGPAVEALSVVLANVGSEDQVWERSKYVMALSYLYDDKYAEALPLLEELIAYDESNMDYWIKAGQAAARIGEDKKASDYIMRYEEMKEAQVVGEG